MVGWKEEVGLYRCSVSHQILHLFQNFINYIVLSFRGLCPLTS